MGAEYKERWFDFLPWILLMKRTAYQKELKASPAMLTYGRNLSIPGDLLVEPGDPYTEPEIQQLVQYMQKHNNKLPAPTRKPSQVEVPEPPLSVTHVYTKQHNKVGLEPSYTGPFEIESRPSRSTVRIIVGLTPKGEPRYELRHWKDLRVAHMRPEAEVASRPKRGRPSKNTSGGSGADLVTDAELEVPHTEGTKVNKVLAPKSDVDDQNKTNSNRGGKPVRSSRNPSPKYVDAVDNISSVMWSASPQELAELNRAIQCI